MPRVQHLMPLPVRKPDAGLGAGTAERVLRAVKTALDNAVAPNDPVGVDQLAFPGLRATIALCSQRAAGGVQLRFHRRRNRPGGASVGVAGGVSDKRAQWRLRWAGPQSKRVRNPLGEVKKSFRSQCALGQPKGVLSRFGVYELCRSAVCALAGRDHSSGPRGKPEPLG